jgi:hypothetical protein
VLNICKRIGVRVPVDLSMLVTWRIVAFAVAGEARACQNFEIGGLPFHLANPNHKDCISVLNVRMGLTIILR